MANISQHEAAELWELSRDHHLTCAKLNWLSSQVQDAELRAMIERHAHHYRQAAERIDGFLNSGSGGFQGGQSGQSGYGQWAGGFAAPLQGQSQGQAGGSYMSGSGSYMSGGGSYFGGSSPYASGGNSYSSQGNSFSSGGAPVDVLAAGECLKDCKSMAVRAVLGATEAAQPARSYLHQLAGEHLQMAEEHYHWLERRGYYASPKAPQQAIGEYSQKLQQIAEAGRRIPQGAQSTQYAYQQAQHSLNYGGAQHAQERYTASQPAQSFGGVSNVSNMSNMSNSNDGGRYRQ